MREQILELLGHGLGISEVALAVGCDPSWISQLMSDESFKAEVQTLRAARTAKHLEHDTNLDQLEARVLERLGKLVDFCTKPGEAAKVFSILNGAKRRAAATAETGAPTGTVVNINLPQAVAVQLQISQDRQVIEVAGRSMTTLPAKQVAAALEQRKATRLLALEVPKTLSLVGEL